MSLRAIAARYTRDSAADGRRGRGGDVAMREEPWVAASELGEWAYCERAWWYGRRRVASANGAALDRGTTGHDAVARAARAAALRRRVALVLLPAALLLAVLALAPLPFGGAR